MHDLQPPTADDVDRCVEDLRAALTAHGITLPSLHADLPSFAGTYRPPAGLVALGNCNTVTARRLAAALREKGPGPVVDVDLLAFPEVVPDLRRAVRRHLGVPCADVQLCVTELVTNVIRHVREGAPVRVRVLPTCDGRIRVEVTDPDARAFPVPVAASGDDESGRGLTLLAAVALRWGVEQGAVGKTVWCEVDGLSQGGGVPGA
jgi:hypothetical protein